jgi:hypothetical protein
MANKFTRFLGGVGEGLTRPKGNMGDWRHASRLFIDDTMRLSPRTKYLFYVQFEFDKTALKSPAFSNKHSSEVGLLVKSADLPKFSFDSTVLNQYNRKKIVYKQINYDPVNINLHDDSAGIVSAMWALYYGYYIADRNNPTAAFGATHLRPVSTPVDNFRYGMDNSISTPFLKSVSIYTMSRRRFLGYTLINPRIKSWNHGTVDYSAGETLESQMSLEYESVAYSSGNVSFGNPKGFATLHYDAIPSPLSVQGGGVANLLGPGGVLDGLDQIFGNVSSGAAFGSVGGFLGTAIATINTYNNAKGLSKEGLKREAVNILSNPNTIRTAVSTIGGVVGAVFPKSGGANTTTDAVQKNLTQQ